MERTAGRGCARQKENEIKDTTLCFEADAFVVPFRLQGSDVDAMLLQQRFQLLDVSLGSTGEGVVGGGRRAATVSGETGRGEEDSAAARVRRRRRGRRTTWSARPSSFFMRSDRSSKLRVWLSLKLTWGRRAAKINARRVEASSRRRAARRHVPGQSTTRARSSCTQCPDPCCFCWQFLDAGCADQKSRPSR